MLRKTEWSAQDHTEMKTRTQLTLAEHIVLPAHYRARCSSRPLDHATFLVHKHLPRPPMIISVGPQCPRVGFRSCLPQLHQVPLVSYGSRAAPSRKEEHPPSVAEPTSQHLVPGSRGNTWPCPDFQPGQRERWFERMKERREREREGWKEIKACSQVARKLRWHQESIGHKHLKVKPLLFKNQFVYQLLSENYYSYKCLLKSWTR